MNKEETEKLATMNMEIKSNTSKIDKLDNKMETIYELTLCIKEMSTEIKVMHEDIMKLDHRVLEVESKPAKRWEKVVDKVIFIILGIVIAYIFSKLGM